jgi:hypothetical protein
MRFLRSVAWFIVVLTLASAVCSVLTDPYFDRFADNPDGTTLEREGDTRPVWRIPAVVPVIFTGAVAFHVLTLVAPVPVHSTALLPDAPFVPPRI